MVNRGLTEEEKTHLVQFCAPGVRARISHSIHSSPASVVSGRAVRLNFDRVHRLPPATTVPFCSSQLPISGVFALVFGLVTPVSRSPLSVWVKASLFLFSPPIPVRGEVVVRPCARPPGCGSPFTDSSSPEDTSGTISRSVPNRVTVDPTVLRVVEAVTEVDLDAVAVLLWVDSVSWLGWCWKWVRSTMAFSSLDYLRGCLWSDSLSATLFVTRAAGGRAPWIEALLCMCHSHCCLVYRYPPFFCSLHVIHRQRPFFFPTERLQSEYLNGAINILDLQ